MSGKTYSGVLYETQSHIAVVTLLPLLLQGGTLSVQLGREGLGQNTEVPGDRDPHLHLRRQQGGRGPVMGIIYMYVYTLVHIALPTHTHTHTHTHRGFSFMRKSRHC